jgi:hypothetical protein
MSFKVRVKPLYGCSKHLKTFKTSGWAKRHAAKHGCVIAQLPEGVGGIYLIDPSAIEFRTLKPF